MKLSRIIVAATLLISLGSVQADPHFALVKVRQIYDQLPSTAVLEQDIGKDRNDIMKDQRADQFRTMISELQAMQAQLTDTKKPLDQETNRKIGRAYDIKRMEAQNIKQEFEEFRTEQEKKINQKLVTSMKASLGRILKTAQTIAQAKGIDYVFDSSGATNTGVGFILYQKGSPDLTEEVKAALMTTEPPMPAPKAAPTPSPVAEPAVTPPTQ
jgi:Skp family chaperone for outer membrane proteins